MAYHSGCGGGQLGGSCCPHILNGSFCQTHFDKFLLTILNPCSILNIEQMFAFTKGVHRMKETKDKLIAVLDKLTSNQIEYIYHLVCKLFGQAPN